MTECIPVELDELNPHRDKYSNHHWVLEEAQGRKFVNGRCKKCGIERNDMRGISSLDSGDATVWGNQTKPQKKGKNMKNLDFGLLDDLADFNFLP